MEPASGRRVDTPAPSRKHSLRAQVILSVVLPLIIILGSFTAIEYTRRERTVLNHLSFLASQTSQVIENSLHQAMLSRDQTELQHTLDAIGEGETIRLVYLLDMTGRVVLASRGRNVGAQLDNRDPACQACHHLPPAERPSSVVITLPDGQRVFRSMNPIENKPECQNCHEPAQRLNGLLLTDISMAPLETPLASDLRENLLWWVATILVTVVVVNLTINRFVLQRLEGLASAIAYLGRGQLPPPIPETRRDEIGLLTDTFNTMARQVEARDTENHILSERLQRQSSLRGELLRRLITAQEDERKRVARELHDELGQALTGLSFQVQAIRQLIKSNRDDASEQLSRTQALINGTTERMYDLILALRPSVLDDLGLAVALRSHAERALAETGIQFEQDSTGLTERLPSEMETTLYRIFQEALNNVVKHAQASSVSVRLSLRDGIFEGEIADDGQGFDPQEVQLHGDTPRGLGLSGMQERVTLCGGRLEIVSSPGNGTHILIRVPLQEATRA